jgi:hypothetical protein
MFLECPLLKFIIFRQFWCWIVGELMLITLKYSCLLVNSHLEPHDVGPIKWWNDYLHFSWMDATTLIISHRTYISIRVAGHPSSVTFLLMKSCHPMCGPVRSRTEGRAVTSSDLFHALALLLQPTTAYRPQ